MKDKKDILAEAIDSLAKIPVSDNVPPDVVEATLENLSKVEIESNRENDNLNFTMERIRKMKKFSKIAVAAVLVCVVLAAVTVFDKTSSVAYALEQTIQASHNIRYIHTKYIFSNHQEPMEAWVEFDAAGAGRTFRVQMPEWADPWGHDGEKTIVWKDNKAHLWLKKKNMFAVMQDNEIADMVFKSTEMFDPKSVLAGLELLHSEGKLTLDIERPADKTSPIIVTATFLETISEESPMTDTERATKKLYNLWKGSENEITKFVLFVDRATRLVTSIDTYEQRESKEHLVNTLEFYDYNQPIAAGMFQIEDEIPDDALRVDQTAEDVGLAQGSLTDAEAGVELIRQFLEALIDQNYAKAGKLWGGVPAERIEKAYGQIRFIKIVSIDEPIPCGESVRCDDDHYCTGVHVACEVQIEENGKISF
ncbi:MAG: hypothetical protein K9M75_09040, partial [Phycisphaerae bacterium]|nr:hypothetical protein [Phycisphaerae bacterium]